MASEKRKGTVFFKFFSFRELAGKSFRNNQTIRSSVGFFFLLCLVCQPSSKFSWDSLHLSRNQDISPFSSLRATLCMDRHKTFAYKAKTVITWNSENNRCEANAHIKLMAKRRPKV
jgi:hypothetical protein